MYEWFFFIFSAAVVFGPMSYSDRMSCEVAYEHFRSKGFVVTACDYRRKEDDRGIPVYGDAEIANFAGRWRDGSVVRTESGDYIAKLDGVWFKAAGLRGVPETDDSIPATEAWLRILGARSNP